MVFFDYLSEEQKKDFFYIPPKPFNKYTKRDVLAYCLGATLYMPATRTTIAEDILSKKHKGLSSLVICLEDAIGDKSLEYANGILESTVEKLFFHIESGKISYDDIPLIFIRPRNESHMVSIFERISPYISVITGFVFPKITCANARTYFESLEKINKGLDTSLYAMPILETEDFIYHEKRSHSLKYIGEIFEEYKNYVLNIRIGATDFCSLFGIRRNEDTTIYDIAVIRNCIELIINQFLRKGSGFVLSGPVWEYFSSGERLLKPQLRLSPFTEHGSFGIKLREKLINKSLDGLIREVLLDKANGIIGKTIIHPTHIIPVEALYVVSHEEYTDACNIIDNNGGEKGVFKSSYSNKMNEIKPHLSWAYNIIKRSEVYGVFHENKSFTDLLAEEEI
ncbi:HpcH/HpaI aldolase/citrate lyase family protein [Acetivibrio saccincola]|uniref:Citrate lyase subunit beta n=1 Tax=Acetivibrio saccincola TaxID=1677857 RepID=A0A2S8RCB4_9FIRM|nr:HpcH/HpaI aldolase/citrate lyase family protein [Acetivibrio saccincola]NLW26023.1 HpcH/HpaI aldolase/citrate lyase family protein [Acetivibrio saccincola]PQQ67440.1 citrate lyase subunit beta [Acetivibrio saccincola]